MKLEKALNAYKKIIQNGNVHLYTTNSCYDTCGHCYMSALPHHSKKSKHINTDDLIHFTKLLQEDKPKGINVTLSGGDPLLHPKITTILDTLSEHSQLDILTSGFALSTKNTEKRKELLDSLIKSDARFFVASPDEPYHSITWKDISEIRSYIKEQGHDPNKLGYPSKTKNIINSILFSATGIGAVALGLNYLLKKCSSNDGMPLSIPIGRAKALPEDQLLPGTKKCNSLDNPSEMYLNYKGELQFCIYTCHDGFMNISELKEIDNKKEATEHIMKRLEESETFQDMVNYERCYFSKKIRKHI